MAVTRRLYRSRTDSKAAGVAGGLGAYLELDSTLVRVAFVLLLFAGGTGLFLYIILALVMPLEPVPTTPPEGVTNPPAVRAEARGEVETDQNRGLWYTVGLGLVVLGAFFLAGNFGLFGFWDWDRLWPLALIGIGVLLLLRRFRRS
ncbi:MAG: PspC domain-containing protein [Chloroflexi bacterium]|nr:PspC domain-containing protein [Chloroflexota bacterium]